MKNDVNVDVKPTSVSVQAAGKHNKRQLKKLHEKAASGSTMTQKVLGKDVTFKLVEVRPNDIDRRTMVWMENERDQELLDEHSLAHLIPSFEENGQQEPAKGRELCGIFEIADGSSRRGTAIITKKPYFAWIGDLTDEQMTYLSDIGNTYKGTSAYEKGKKYKRLLKQATQEEVANAVKLTRKAMMRNVKTASLPKSFIRCLSSPNELSARRGEALFTTYSKIDEQQQDEVIEFFKTWVTTEKGSLGTEDIIELFVDKCGITKKVAEVVEPKELAMGATVKVKNGNATFNVPKVSDDSLAKIEAFISKTLSEEAVNNC